MFVAGQTWPTETPFTLVLATSQDQQQTIELVLGEPENQARHDVVFVNGLPTLRDSSGPPVVRPWECSTIHLPLGQPGELGQDCLRLAFRLDEEAQLLMEGTDLRTGEPLPARVLGPVR